MKTRRQTVVDIDELKALANSLLSAKPRPFLKWAGSKKRLLGRLVEHVPTRFGHYYEPFLGGGSLFFLLRPRRATLGDTCVELIETFRSVRDDPGTILRHLNTLSQDRETYYKVRSNRSEERLRRAAEFIYLNKTCWNGLYRVNSRGEFNVPYGKPPAGPPVEPDNLRACARALAGSGVSLVSGDFERCVSDAEEGDLVFFDPPYVTGHSNNGFVDYNEVLFSWDDQQRLADLADWLAKNGRFVIVTNADHEMIASLYWRFTQVRVSRQSTIASNPTKRRRATELILLGGSK